MLHAKLGQKIVRVMVCVALLLTISPSVFAAAPHEEPDTAKVVFSGLSLLRYYTDSLNFVLLKDPAEVKARLEKMPFANILQSLEQPAANFTTSGVEVSYSVVTIDGNIGTIKGLIGQSRLREATQIAAETFAELSQAYAELDGVQQAAETTGADLKVLSAPENSTLRLAYNDLLEMIDRIRQLLDLYKNLLLNMFLTPEEAQKLPAIEKTMSVEEAQKLAEQLAAILAGGRLLPTDITLEIDPTSAFVGDNISFGGLLTSEGKPMAGRKVDILLDSSHYVTVETDTTGRYQGTLQVPYWYIPEIDVQALYYPQDKDIGVYLASLSPAVKLKVLFYEANLDVTLEAKAYPGLETTVTGSFNYGQAPPLNERLVEIYLDDVLTSQAIEQKTFSVKIGIDPKTELGKHNVTVSAVPAGRYASVLSGAVLNVTKAIPILDMNLPRIALIPGSIGLTGKLYSEIGPLDKAPIKMGLGKSQVEVVSSEDGAFNTKISVGMGLGLIGSQDLAIQVLPSEPWNATLVTTRSLVIVNWVNCGSILIILGFLAVYLPRRLQRRFGVYLRKRERPIAAVAQSESVPAYSQAVVVPVPAKENRETLLEPRDRILNWYRLIARLIQSISKALLGPQETLREFASERSKILGPAAKYFIQLTMMVEKLLYSRYKPTEEDAEKSKQLSNDVEEGLKGESV